MHRRGARDAEQHRVTNLKVGPTQLTATVIGSELYSVSIDREQDPSGCSVRVACTCPSEGLCKHAWAVTLKAMGSHAAKRRCLSGFSRRRSHAVRVLGAREDFGERALARAVGPDERQPLAIINAERHAREQRPGGKVLRDVANRDEGAHEPGRVLRPPDTRARG